MNKLREIREREGLTLIELDRLSGVSEKTIKYIENGEHLVNIVVWTEGFTGVVWQNAKCTVKLVSKEDPIKWK